MINKVNELYKTLIDALSMVRQKTNWRVSVQDKYHCFAGPYHGIADAHRLHIKTQHGDQKYYLCLELIPRLSRPDSARTGYTKEEYSKRLLGNVSSCCRFAYPHTGIF